jgi:hypothetical protein
MYREAVALSGFVGDNGLILTWCIPAAIPVYFGSLLAKKTM